jgi:hemerythrin
MEWNDQLSVGVAVFDDEHKNLVGMINELYDSLGAGIDDVALRHVADHTVEHAMIHFRHEEMYFREAAYPAAEEHAALHEGFKQRVFTYRDRIGHENTAALAEELMQFLRAWLADHVLVEDKKYGVYLNAAGIF